MTTHPDEPPRLKRLRRAVERGGLTVERFSTDNPEGFLVSAEVAQATLDCLRRAHPDSARALEAELARTGTRWGT